MTGFKRLSRRKERVMKHYPALYEAEYLGKYLAMHEELAKVNNQWVTARPVGYPSLIRRFKFAWMVFTGKADAVIWPGQ